MAGRVAGTVLQTPVMSVPLTVARTAHWTIVWLSTSPYYTGMAMSKSFLSIHTSVYLHVHVSMCMYASTTKTFIPMYLYMYVCIG